MAMVTPIFCGKTPSLAKCSCGTWEPRWEMFIRALCILMAMAIRGGQLRIVSESSQSKFQAIFFRFEFFAVGAGNLFQVLPAFAISIRFAIADDCSRIRFGHRQAR